LHFSQRAQLAIGRMERVIHVLLDYARMENATTLQLEVCDLKACVKGILEISESLIKEKQLNVAVDVPSSEQFVQADSRLLEHIVANLITNAIKYNRMGGSVQVKTYSAGDFIRVDVSDTGIGIPSDYQNRVWDRFYRVERGRVNNVEGTGLGLAIVKSVVERHGGAIHLTSVEGEGATFTFTLPRATSSSSEYDREPPDDIDDESQESRESLDQSDADLREV